MRGSRSLHRLGCGQDQRRPLLDGLVANLMGAPVFVADAPEVDVQWPGVAVVLAQPGVRTLAGLSMTAIRSSNAPGSPDWQRRAIHSKPV